MPGIVTLIGSTIDSDHGYDQILMPDGKGWAVKPDRGVIDFIVKYPSPTAIRRQITLTADSRNSARIIDIDVSTAFSTAGDDWVQVAVCRPSGPDANVFTCPVQPRTISRIKIVARTRTGDPLTITSLSVE